MLYFSQSICISVKIIYLVLRPQFWHDTSRFIMGNLDGENDDQKLYHKRAISNDKSRITPYILITLLFFLLKYSLSRYLKCVQMKKCCIAYLGEPSPPSIHGQPSSGKSFKLSITKQDDGGAPILEYIVKYRSVSTLFIIISY